MSESGRQRPESGDASLLAALLEASEDAIIGESLDGVVTRWNKGAEHLFGYTAAEMIGRTVAHLSPAWRADEVPLFLERVGRGEGVPLHETERRRKDGTVISVALTVWPVYDRSGRVAGAVKIARDTAAIKATEYALQEREAHLRSILDTVPVGMIVIDEHGIVRSFGATAERMFGYAAGEVIGRSVSMLLPAPDRVSHDRYVERYLATGEHHVIGFGRIVEGRRKDGTAFPIELAVGELKADGHRLFTGFVRDLSERQQAERRLQQLQFELSHVTRLTEMGQMASTLVHEISQPLTAAITYCQVVHRLLAEEDSPNAKRVQPIAEKATAQIARAVDILRRLREFLSKGKRERAAHNVGRLVEESSALALIGAREAGVKVKLRVEPDLPPVLVDKVQIQQVVVNLTRNAIEAMEGSERRELTIVAGRGGNGMVRVRIADTGPGLAPEIADRLFEPFFTTKPRGMGVGLSICRSIVEAHGGHLTAEPNPGGGAIFEFTVASRA